MHRLLIPLLLALLFLPHQAPAASTNDALARATAAIQAATPRVQTDPAHPIFHVTSPAQWINDPNGPIYYKGYYHLFYQLNPFSDGSGPKYWGHVRSRDLATWERLPVALWPSTEMGEAEVWSGCCTINGLGQPMIFYTSIAQGTSPQNHAEQWAAIGDDHLIEWHKSPANPVLSEALHNGKKIYDWRDPFVFHSGSHTFLVTGGNLNQAAGGQATVNIYEAQNPALTEWQYRGVLFQLPDPGARTAECPNFFQLGDKWVLFVSPYGKVQYYVGDFNPDTCRFQPQTQGFLDYGPGFYAPNTMLVPDGRRLTWGWVNGFPGGRGWNGCLSLPRLLSLTPDGQLRQSPAPQLTKLRGKSVKWRNLPLDEHGHAFDLPSANTLEIQTEITLPASASLELCLQGDSSHSHPVVLNLNASTFKLGDAAAPLALANGENNLHLRIFVDRSVLEVFVNDTVCATKVIPTLDVPAMLQIHTQGGAARLNLLQIWTMKSIW